MKLRFFSLILLIFLSINVFAEEATQDTPDYAKIEQAIKDENSSYYYPKLMARLRAFDPNLTDKEFEYLYYGYTFNKNYKPYVRFKNEKELDRYPRVNPWYLKTLQLHTELT